MPAIWENMKIIVNISLQQYLQFTLEYCKRCCCNKGVMSFNGTGKHDSTDLYQVYYSRESYNKSRMYLCHTQNVILVTDETDEEK